MICAPHYIWQLWAEIPPWYKSYTPCISFPWIQLKNWCKKIWRTATKSKQSKIRCQFLHTRNNNYLYTTSHYLIIVSRSPMTRKLADIIHPAYYFIQVKSTVKTNYICTRGQFGPHLRGRISKMLHCSSSFWTAQFAQCSEALFSHSRTKQTTTFKDKFVCLFVCLFGLIQRRFVYDLVHLVKKTFALVNLEMLCCSI